MPNYRGSDLQVAKEKLTPLHVVIAVNACFFTNHVVDSEGGRWNHKIQLREQFKFRDLNLICSTFQMEHM